MSVEFDVQFMKLTVDPILATRGCASMIGRKTLTVLELAEVLLLAAEAVKAKAEMTAKAVSIFAD